MEELDEDIERETHGCLKCHEREENTQALHEYGAKYQKLYETTLAELQSARDEVFRLKDDVNNLKEKERQLEEDKKALENNLTVKAESVGRNSQSSIKLKKSSAALDQNNIGKELLQKMMALEETNKKLNRKIRMLSKEITDAEAMYGERLEFLYVACINLARNPKA